MSWRTSTPPGGPPVRSLSEAERAAEIAAREELCQVCRLLYQRGYTVGHDGNVSLRLGEDQILVTPSGVGKGRLRPEMLVKCTLSGEVLEGDRLLQTITPPHALPQPRAFDSDTAAQVTPSAANAPASGFSAENQFHALDLRDVNFDGFPDLGLPWDTTHNDVHLWYLWDGGTRTFQYAFALQGDLTIDTDQQLLTENRWEEGPHIYSFNARGQICWYGPGGA